MNLSITILQVPFAFCFTAKLRKEHVLANMSFSLSLAIHSEILILSFSSASTILLTMHKGSQLSSKITLSMLTNRKSVKQLPIMKK